MSHALPPPVRLARLDDTPELVELCRQLGYPQQEGVLRDRIDLLLGRPLLHRLVVAPAVEDDRKLVGAIHAALREVLESDNFVEISALVVDERARGTGVGKEMMRAVERWARDLGVRTVRVRTNVVRVESHAFYRHLGYRELKQQIAFIKDV
ncbi:MAG TPA: GNAT family N-acetyltransferase [Myxococcales bacterium]|jgi:GNAT superfamily N-acetyltransferase|nr:GNAT family N-acetyltransferase [Myxococcales bacterium]